MTPGNIVAMAGILELPVFAVSDHNSAKNLPAVCRLAAEQGLLAVPAMEISTAEEIHVLALFPSLDAALDMDAEIYACLPPIANRPEIFGDQLILDENDRVVGQAEKLLINAVSLSIEAVFEKVRQRGGVPVPAHIDKPAYSVLSSLGFLPPELHAQTVEVSPRGLERGFSPPGACRVVSSSDAHSLEAMTAHLPASLELPQVSLAAILQALESPFNPVQG